MFVVPYAARKSRAPLVPDADMNYLINGNSNGAHLRGCRPRLKLNQGKGTLSLRLTPAPVYTLFYLLLLCGSQSFSPAAAVFGATLLCQRLPGLAPRQRSICQGRPDAMVAVGQGANLALMECQHQMALQRWNCTAPRGLMGRTLFGQPHVFSTSEAAFSAAITTAGVAYSMTKSCAQGRITGCGCDVDKFNKLTNHGWRWGGCSADWRYGVRFAQKFLDAAEIEGTQRGLVNIHNNAAGRKALKDEVVFKCKCHGVSGSCTQRTCWNTLPSFRDVGNRLIQKYHRSRRAKVVKGGRSMYLLVTSKRGNRKPRRRNLIYLDASPNYCNYDRDLGILGTQGRECSVDPNAQNSCDVLCCGRGYNTEERTEKANCNCKFIWCCDVICDTCVVTRRTYTCK